MAQTTRITAEHLNSAQLQGQSIRAVGKLLSVDAATGMVQLEMLGNAAATANVTCPGGTHKYALETQGKGYYEVIGTLMQGGAIQEMNCVYMGENLDTNMYVEMVKLTHQFPDIF